MSKKTQMIYNNSENACCFFRSTVKKPDLKILLQITERCNLKCKHCFVSSLSDGSDLSIENIRDILLPKLIKAKVTRVTLTGGEPMVHRNIIDIINLFAENNIHITLCTNALGLNENTISKISKIKNIHVNVSLDGFSKESHGKFRGNTREEVFNKIIANIKLLSQYNLLNGIMTSPNIYANTNEYVEISKFAKKLNANYILFNPLSKFGRGEQSQNLGYTQKQLIELRNKIEEEKLEDNMFQTIFIRIPKESSQKKQSRCNYEIPYIFSNGDVAVCPYMVFACGNKESKYDKKDFLYGNILDSEFNLIESMNEWKLPEYVESTVDNKYGNCGSGCMAIKIAHGLSIFDCDIEMCNKSNK